MYIAQMQNKNSFDDREGIVFTSVYQQKQKSALPTFFQILLHKWLH